jgi:hypothetical protein
MKKLIIAFLAMSLGSFSMASAELGVNIGVSGQMGVFVADGSETERDTMERDNTTTLVGYNSVFIEKTLGSRLTIGYDYVPQSLSTDTAESTRRTDIATTGTNSVAADFEDLSTVYASINITENFYITGGFVTVDVITKESLATGSAYPNTSLDGEMYGAGYNYDFDNGLFLRAEANVMMMDGVTLTSSTNSDNVIKLDHLNGANGKVSIGKSF